MKNFKSFFLRLYCILILFAVVSNVGNAQSVKINEYSCANMSSFVSNLGTYEDWIELYNTTGAAVNLNGYYLSNKATNLTKWKFGNVSIPANGFLRIWASGANVSVGPNLHTNFSLTQCKPDKIIFSDPSAVILDSLTIRPTKVKHSRGRTTNGAATWSVFLNPTPGTSNIAPQQDYAATPTMNVAPGFYPGTQLVTIACTSPSVTIHYTTNGTTPKASSPTYTAPVSIASTKVLRAIAISSVPNTPQSFIESNTYFIAPPHSVSVVSIFGDSALILLNGNSSSPETGIQYFDSSGTFRTEGYGMTNKHGNDSWSYPQRGIDFVSHDQYGYSDVLKHRFFNSKSRQEFQRIILKAAANDNYPFECPAAGNPNAWGDPTLYDGAHIRDQYVQTVAQKAGLYVDARTWAPCVMYVNGQYWGVYDLREKVDDKDYTKYYYNSSSDSLQMLKTWGGTWSEYGGTQAQNDWTNLSNFITTNNMAVAANYNYVDSLYNVKSLADYVILNSYCVTSDWLNWNTEWWRGTNAACDKKKWRYCLWDEDATFHHYINYTGVPSVNANADPCDPQSLGDPGGEGHVPILNALLQNPNFKQYYVLRYFDLINSGLSCTRMTQILDSMVLQITPEMPKQIAKWGGSISAWQQNVLNLRNFILQRCDSVTQHFNNCYNTTGPYKIKVNVDPPGSGTVDFNSVHISSFVWSGLYPGNLTVSLTEHPNPNYCFSHWEFTNNTPLPNTLDSTVTTNLVTTDSIIAHFILAPTVSVSPANAQICSGDSVQLTVSGGTSYTWSPGAGLSCVNCANPYVHPVSTTIYTVVASSGPGCLSQSTKLVTVLPPDLPIISPAVAQVCAGDSVRLTASGGVSYTWTPGSSLTCSVCPDPYAHPTVTTNYTVTATNTQGCKNKNSQIVTVLAPTPPLISPSNPKFCAGDSVQLTATGGTSYTWTPAAGLSCTTCANPYAHPVSTTIYTVAALNGSGCVNKNSQTVTVLPYLVASFADTIQNTGLPATVNFYNTTNLATSYSWNFGSGFTASGATTTYTYAAAGTYSVTLLAMNSTGCNDSITQIVIIPDTLPTPKLVMPNFFTPNGDGLNDYFQPITTAVKDFSCTIFDRWGKIIYEFAGVTDKWSGQNKNGTAVPDGTYYYIVKAKDDNSKSYDLKGFLQLVR